MENNQHQKILSSRDEPFWLSYFNLLPLLILPFDLALADCVFEGSTKYKESTFLTLLFFGFSITTLILGSIDFVRSKSIAACVHLLLLPISSFFLWQLNLRFQFFDETAVFSQNSRTRDFLDHDYRL